VAITAREARKNLLRDPINGIGKPEPLRHVPAGCWSRHTDDEHRLVYLVDHDDIVVIQARYHGCGSKGEVGAP